MIELIPENGKFYKVNMHCHTDISDGKQTPEEVKEFFKKNGYSAVCYTDHEVLIGHKDLCDEEFIALHGYEVAIKQDLTRHTSYFMPVYHFNFIAKDQDNLNMPCYFKENPSFAGNAREWSEKYGQYSETIDTTEYSIEWINSYLEKVAAGGFLVNYNHPEWSLQNCNDYIGLEHLHSIETFNGGCTPVGDASAIHYQQLLRTGHRVVPTGGDDNHSEKDCLNSWTMIKAEELTYDALIAAYERGDCYASEGPEILRLFLEDGKIIVETSPASCIVLRGEGRHAQKVRSKTETFTRAEFNYSPEKFGKFFRIEVRDAAGYYAYSSAYYVEDIEAKL